MDEPRKTPRTRSLGEVTMSPLKTPISLGKTRRSRGKVKESRKDVWGCGKDGGKYGKRVNESRKTARSLGEVAMSRLKTPISPGQEV